MSANMDETSFEVFAKQRKAEMEEARRRLEEGAHLLRSFSSESGVYTCHEYQCQDNSRMVIVEDVAGSTILRLPPKDPLLSWNRSVTDDGTSVYTDPHDSDNRVSITPTQEGLIHDTTSYHGVAHGFKIEIEQDTFVRAEVGSNGAITLVEAHGDVEGKVIFQSCNGMQTVKDGKLVDVAEPCRNEEINPLAETIKRAGNPFAALSSDALPRNVEDGVNDHVSPSITPTLAQGHSTRVRE